MKRLAFLLLFLLSFGAAAQQDAQTILHLLDYIGVDYPEAVADGKVKNEDEYKEMVEFAAQVATRIGELPANASRPKLASDAESLRDLVKRKATPAEVATASTKLRWALVEAYKLKLAPRAAPDLARGKVLYAQHCASCHGAEGKGDGPAARGLEPAPSDFHDLDRMAQRSAYGLYNTITLGVDGTSMAPFRQLPEDDRWALAFFASVVGVPAERIESGRKLWESNARKAFSDLAPVATLSAREVTERFGANAALVQDYLRANPRVLKPAPLPFARAKLAEARAAHERGDRNAARDAAIQGYLEGFELVEASLANVDAGLMREIERRMLELRGAIERGVAAAEVQAQISSIESLLENAEEKLGGEGLSPATAFTASLVILLREGLEAILVLAAILAFVRKTGRRDALPWVHAGWIAALGLGLVTWIVAAFVIDISGANRELTEGVTALLAAAMLLYVGYWLHEKSYAQAWTRFLREQVGQALAKRTLWAMAGVSFLAVYREAFEIVLFYQALWAQVGDAGHSAVLGGMGAAVVALAVIGFAIFRYSVRLPIGAFFSATSLLLAALAVIFTGHGIAALQEAGAIGVTSLGFEAIPLLGIYPSGEAIGAQVLALTIVVVSFLSTFRRASHEPAMPNTQGRSRWLESARRRSR